MDNKELQDELEYLRWFHGNADFGPADCDVRYFMNQKYTNQTGRPVPAGYSDEE